MNVALPALVVFFILLPGFIFRTQRTRAERTSLDYSPFGQVAAEAVLWAIAAHLVWLSISYLFFHRRIEPTALMNLLSANSTSQAQAVARVSVDFKWVCVYFVTLLCACNVIPKLLRLLISQYKLDRDAAPFSSIFRFRDAPWYYLLTPADFETSDEPDFIVISAIVDVAGVAVLYVGVLDEFFVNSDGQLDRLVLREVMRRSLKADKTTNTPDEPVPPRFYDIDGDYFVLRYSEAITLNVRYAKLIPAEIAEAGAACIGPSASAGCSPDRSQE